VTGHHLFVNTCLFSPIASLVGRVLSLVGRSAFIQTLRENEPKSRDNNLKCKWVPVIQLELEVIFNSLGEPRGKQILGIHISIAVGKI
jgi:hypothetical protein